MQFLAGAEFDGLRLYGTMRVQSEKYCTALQKIVSSVVHRDDVSGRIGVIALWNPNYDSFPRSGQQNTVLIACLDDSLISTGVAPFCTLEFCRFPSLRVVIPCEVSAPTNANTV